MGRKDILPICIKAGALDENVPRRDLWISPHHAMYLEGVLIEAKDLVNGVSIVQTERVEKVEYFHIELDSHDVIIAEGRCRKASSTTTAEACSTTLMSIARSIRRRRRARAILYAAARRRLRGRGCATAHCAASRDTVTGYELWVGALRGCIDLVSPRCIAGWAQNVDYPEAPVCLPLRRKPPRPGNLANRYREDLRRAGLGSGCHGFEFTSPDGLDFASDALEVRRSLDGAGLKLSVLARR